MNRKKMFINSIQNSVKAWLWHTWSTGWKKQQNYSPGTRNKCILTWVLRAAAEYFDERMQMIQNPDIGGSPQKKFINRNTNKQ